MPLGVPDTSVIVSAFLFTDSVPAIALRHLNRTGKMLASAETLSELREVLQREKFRNRLSPMRRERLLRQFEAQVETIQITEVVTICRDPKDNKFLSLALSGKADLILSGDVHLLELHPFRNIDILTASAYLAAPTR